MLLVTIFRDSASCFKRAGMLLSAIRRFSPKMHCKGTKNRDAKQAFFKFFSDLFQMLKYKETRTQ